MGRKQIVAGAICVGVLAMNVLGKDAAGKPLSKFIGEKHVYKTVGEEELCLYIVNPADWKPTDERPAVVFFHGGGWVKGGPFQFNEHSKYLASRGMVCIQVQYRLLKGKGSEPPTTCIQDAKSAMRWARSNASKLGIDPDRIASGGGSAGGHLAAFVGMMDGMDDPRDDLSVSASSAAMLLFNPVFDNGPSGYGYKRVGDDYRKYSPFHNISKGDPPAIVFLGDDDSLIPVETAETFQRQMNGVGTECRVLIFEGMPHSFFNYSKYDHVPYYKTILACDQFLVDLGWLTGPPSLEVPGGSLDQVHTYSLPRPTSVQ